MPAFLKDFPRSWRPEPVFFRESGSWPSRETSFFVVEMSMMSLIERFGVPAGEAAAVDQRAGLPNRGRSREIIFLNAYDRMLAADFGVRQSKEVLRGTSDKILGLQAQNRSFVNPSMISRYAMMII